MQCSCTSLPTHTPTHNHRQHQLEIKDTSGRSAVHLTSNRTFHYDRTEMPDIVAHQISPVHIRSCPVHGLTPRSIAFTPACSNLFRPIHKYQHLSDLISDDCPVPISPFPSMVSTPKRTPTHGRSPERERERERERAQGEGETDSDVNHSNDRDKDRDHEHENSNSDEHDQEPPAKRHRRPRPQLSCTGMLFLCWAWLISECRRLKMKCDRQSMFIWPCPVRPS